MAWGPAMPLEALGAQNLSGSIITSTLELRRPSLPSLPSRTLATVGRAAATSNWTRRESAQGSHDRWRVHARGFTKNNLLKRGKVLQRQRTAEKRENSSENDESAAESDDERESAAESAAESAPKKEPETKVQEGAEPNGRSPAVAGPSAPPPVTPPAASASPAVNGTGGAPAPRQEPAGGRGPRAAITVEDLMVMIKDAEKNILLLNRVRTRALKDLEQARTENELLKGQVEVLQARLSEAEARSRVAAQSQAKGALLEDQVLELQRKVTEMSRELLGREQVVADAAVLQEQVLQLQSKLVSAEDRLDQMAGLRAENVELRQTAELLQSRLADVDSQREKGAVQSATENDLLRDQVARLAARLREADQGLVALERTRAELAEVQREAGSLKEQLAQQQAETQEAKGSASGGDIQVTILEEQVMLLKAKLAERDAERAVLAEAQAENTLLSKQVELLRQRLLASDAEIRTQLEAYQAEVEAFQANLDRLQEGDDEGDGEVPIGVMPWEFWSRLLLRIDALMLGKYLTADEGLELRLLAWQRSARIRDAYVAVQDERMFSNDDVAGCLKELVRTPKSRPGLHIVHVAAEMAPVAKVGGLADVVTGLGRALQRKGHLVEFILPKYDNMDYSRIKDLTVVEPEYESFFEGEMHRNKIWRGIVEGLPVYFIEPYHPGRFFWRGTFYGCDDDVRRFTYFCRAALEFLYRTKKRPDIIHCHDWQTAAVAPLYWELYAPRGMDSAQVAFTCHNFEYQGTAPPNALAACGLPVDRMYRPERMQDNFMHDRINLLKGGLVFSNLITTVSNTYAQEVRGPDGGKGLHVTLGQIERKFFGVLNGIDDDAWNPTTDPLLQFQYSADDLSGKFACKAALRARLGLSSRGADGDRPLVGCVTRLVPQKGVHLIRHAIFRTLDKGGQFVLLGSSPVPNIQRDFEGLANQFNNHPHVRLILKYDESLSHAIYAASDMFIIPSIFEPCGLTQLIAMRYGAIPVARRTGGLNDSVFDVDDKSLPEDRKNGFTFTAADEQGLNYALDRALHCFFTRRDWWESLVVKAMRMDFSWDKPSEGYLELYKAAIARAETTRAL